MVRTSSFLINVKIYLLFFILEYIIDTLVIMLFTDCKGLWYINMIFEYMILFTLLCRLTFKELLEFGLVHVVRDVAHEELLGVGVPDHPATLGLPLLPLPN